MKVRKIGASCGEWSYEALLLARESSWTQLAIADAQWPGDAADLSLGGCPAPRLQSPLLPRKVPRSAAVTRPLAAWLADLARGVDKFARVGCQARFGSPRPRSHTRADSCAADTDRIGPARASARGLRRGPAGRVGARLVSSGRRRAHNTGVPVATRRRPIPIPPSPDSTQPRFARPYAPTQSVSSAMDVYSTCAAKGSSAPLTRAARSA